MGERVSGFNDEACLSSVAEECTRCGACQVRCAFLRKHGMPGELARVALERGEPGSPHECSLCGLCTVACPESLDPASIFPVLRRQVVSSGSFDEKPYRPVLQYQALGDSRLLSLLRLPDGGDTVFFPGCALPSTRPETVRRLFGVLDKLSPGMGISLGCCMKPSHDLGKQDHFEDRFGRLLAGLVDAGVKTVITACPNCQAIFTRYGDDLEAVTAYAMLAESDFVPMNAQDGAVVVHDPCPQRHDRETQDAVRELAGRCGLDIGPMPGEREWTRCCGEGGMVKFADPSLAESWTRERVASAEGRDIVTSCAGCANYLKSAGNVRHVLDVLLGVEPSRWLVPPLTYAARLRLKRWFSRLPQFR